MLAIVAAFKAFVTQAKENHLNYCKSVVAKAKQAEDKPETAKKTTKKSK